MIYALMIAAAWVPGFAFIWAQVGHARREMTGGCEHIAMRVCFHVTRVSVSLVWPVSATMLLALTVIAEWSPSD